MKNFLYYNPAKIIFGKDSHLKIGELLQKHNASSLLMIYSGEYIKELGIYSTVEEACKKNNIKFFTCGDVVPNPELKLVKKLINTCRENNVDFILAVGGGSPIDTAKAVSMGVNYDGDVWDFFTKDVQLNKPLPIGVISTLPASGSESSTATIISNDKHKLGYEHEDIIPKFAILNPDFTLSLPNYQTACGIADIYSHLLERYFSPTEHTDATDYLIEGAIKALILNAKRIIDNPKNFDARSEIQVLASIAHNGILDVGRISCWGSHRIEHEISAMYGITHGEGMGIVLIAFTKYMAHNKPERLMQLANRVYNYDYHNYNAIELALKVPEELRKFFKMLGLKTTLTELNIDDSKFEEMANKATKNNTSPVGHYMALDNEKIIEILKLALK